ncbi:MAG: hypothetical protein UR43_C0022G0006 [candidate division TM6 bacterium GW2011_GWF2_33_332]|nr:MAG: hypothetical protein UR43_C0022G0006 [candidate division TM6 bacterium GW2011_GWF2_33_332]
MDDNKAIIETGYFKNTLHYNTEVWRESALHFNEFERYTNYPVNDHPSSRYYKFWEEEARRSVYGYDIGRDKIPGYFYFYLNYSPIYKAIEIDIPDDETDQDAVAKLYQQAKADRVFTLPDFWDGDYQYFWYLDDAEANGEHGVVIKSRRRGYSYKAGSMCDRNYYLIPGSKSFVFADDKAFLIEDGLLSKAWEMMDHIEQHTPWGKRRQKHDTTMYKRSSYIVDQKGLKIEKGFKSEIMGISMKNDYQKVRGKGGKLLIYEESGKNPNLLQAWNISLKSMQQGRLTHGLAVSFGTGGTEDSDFMGLEQLFYQGDAYNIHQVPNIWDEGSLNSKCGHFVSIEQNLEGAMDKDGNSLKDIAREMVDHSRNKIIKATKNPETIIRFIAEEPRTPQEAVMRIGGTIFPINDLKHHLNHLTSNPEKYEEQEYVGFLEINEETQKIEWKPSADLHPIRRFPELDKRNLQGAIIIYEQPVIIDGVIPWGIYIAGNDTYDHDKSTTDSLGSTFIMNRITERIVAEYTGRPSTANEYYEGVRRLLIYYRAICNYENNWKGLFTYLNNRHSAHLLCDTPKIIVDKIFDKSLLNRGKGTPGTAPIQKWGREQILIWLTTSIEPGSEILNLHRIRSIPLLQELIYWNPKGNFDRVDALQMLMILKEDMQHIHPDDMDKKPQDALSPFFKRMEMFQEKLKQESNPFSTINKRLQLENRNKN